MLRIGIVGFGFMGRMHYRCWSDRNDSEVAAVCDANPNLEADTKTAIGNLEGAEEDIDFSGFACYTDLDAMLAAEKLDAVSITLPTPLHPAFTAKAFEAGVHVLCEKPMALNLPDCEAMMAAAERAGKHLLVGHCIRFWPEYAHARRAVISGKYGDVIAASFRRLSGAPGLEPRRLAEERGRLGRRGPGPAHPRHGFHPVRLRPAPVRDQQGRPRAGGAPSGTSRPPTTSRTALW